MNTKVARAGRGVETTHDVVMRLRTVVEGLSARIQ